MESDHSSTSRTTIIAETPVDEQRDRAIGTSSKKSRRFGPGDASGTTSTSDTCSDGTEASKTENEKMSTSDTTNARRNVQSSSCGINMGGARSLSQALDVATTLAAEKPTNANGAPKFRSDGKKHVDKNSLTEAELIEAKMKARADKNKAEMTEEEKQDDRRASNRLSAFQSRQRRKIVIDGLQKQVASLTKESTRQRNEIDQLKRDNMALLRDNELLRMQLAASANVQTTQTLNTANLSVQHPPRQPDPSGSLVHESSAADNSLKDLLLGLVSSQASSSNHQILSQINALSRQQHQQTATLGASNSLVGASTDAAALTNAASQGVIQNLLHVIFASLGQQQRQLQQQTCYQQQDRLQAQTSNHQNRQTSLLSNELLESIQLQQQQSQRRRLEESYGSGVGAQSSFAGSSSEENTLNLQQRLALVQRLQLQLLQPQPPQQPSPNQQPPASQHAPNGSQQSRS